MPDYALARSSRKTIAIYVRDGGVEVRAPLKAPRSDIEAFVASKEKWIAGRLALARERPARGEALNYGGLALYRGKEYPLAARNGNRLGFDGAEFYMPPGLPAEHIKAVCVRIYRTLARRRLTEATLAFAERMGLSPLPVKINGANSRWGSRGKNINFSWRLIMADDGAIDYVVVHELAHLTEMNHSPRFWAIVEAVLPDYRERRARLKEWQARLGAQGW